MRRLLLFDLLAQVVELIAGAIDLSPRLFQLLAVHFHHGARQPPTGTVDDG
jgi:hypothetical protein